MFDAWSVAHVVSGFAAKKVGLSLTETVVLAIAWEIFEFKVAWSWFPEPTEQDTRLNMAGDVLCAVVGWYIG